MAFYFCRAEVFRLVILPAAAKQEGPDGLTSDVASARLPAAAIPAILSAFVDATSVRMWRASPAVRPGMSMLDLERWWHLKDRVGVDISVGTLQVKLSLLVGRCRGIRSREKLDLHRREGGGGWGMYCSVGRCCTHSEYCFAPIFVPGGFSFFFLCSWRRSLDALNGWHHKRCSMLVASCAEFVRHSRCSAAHRICSGTVW